MFKAFLKSQVELSEKVQLFKMNWGNKAYDCAKCLNTTTGLNIEQSMNFVADKLSKKSPVCPTCIKSIN